MPGLESALSFCFRSSYHPSSSLHKLPLPVDFFRTIFAHNHNADLMKYQKDRAAPALPWACVEDMTMLSLAPGDSGQDTARDRRVT